MTQLASNELWGRVLCVCCLRVWCVYVYVHVCVWCAEVAISFLPRETFPALFCELTSLWRRDVPHHAWAELSLVRLPWVPVSRKDKGMQPGGGGGLHWRAWSSTSWPQTEAALCPPTTMARMGNSAEWKKKKQSLSTTALIMITLESAVTCKRTFNSNMFCLFRLTASVV